MSKIKVGIVGLGLMGGSFALALKQRSQTYYFIGLDHNAAHCEQAIELGLVDEIADSLIVPESADIESKDFAKYENNRPAKISLRIRTVCYSCFGTKTFCFKRYSFSICY